MGQNKKPFIKRVIDHLKAKHRAKKETSYRKRHTASINRKWREMNPHNHTVPAHKWYEKYFPIDRVHVGANSYGPIRVEQFSQNDGQLYIGAFCSIASGVTFLLGGEHDYRNVSTYPFKFYYLHEAEALSKGDIVIDDDVWIGYDCLILSGVHLARGTVVAAGSVVVSSTEPYSIIGGNPAKLIKKRFSDKTIERLMKIDFSKWDEKFIMENMQRLYTHVEEGKK